MDLLPECARAKRGKTFPQTVGNPDQNHACWEPKPEEPEQGVMNL